MQLIHLSIPQGSFYNPATGELIIDAYEGQNTSALSLKGVWNHEVINSPDLFDEELAGAWNTQYDTFLAAEEYSQKEGYTYSDYEEMLERFLSDYQHEDWIAFRIRSTVFGCGPVGVVNWYVVEI